MTDIKVDPFTSRTNLYNSASIVDFNRLLDFTFLRPASAIYTTLVIWIRRRLPGDSWFQLSIVSAQRDPDLL